MTNKEFADLLYRIAEILELQRVEWKPNAYRKAAKSIEHLAEDTRTIYERGGKDALQTIPGVGSSIADHLAEYIKHGRVKKFDSILNDIPDNANEILQIEGIGTKKAHILKRMGIDSLEKLKRAIEMHELRGYPGFGTKTEKNILRSLEAHRQQKERMPLSDARSLANDIVRFMLLHSNVRKAEIAGSIRRKKETVGDIDIVIASEEPDRVIELFTHVPRASRILLQGTTKASIRLKDGIQADLRVVPLESYATALQYLTGSKDHNIHLRQRAMEKGYKLSEYGLFNRKTGERVHCRTEEEIYAILGVSYIPPEKREGKDEIELASRETVTTHARSSTPDKGLAEG